MVGYYDIFLKLTLSLFLAGIIGFEREAHGRAAGLRTHMLVAVGSCLIMLTSIHVFELYRESTVCDPARIAAGVVTGIGFLGAGTILRYRASVIGLTTAASIWAVAAIGLAIGTGFYMGGIFTTFLVIATLFVISKLEYKIIRKNWFKTLIVEAHVNANQLHKIRDTLSGYKIEIRDFEIEKIPNRTEALLIFDIKLTSSKYDDNIIMELLNLEGVNKAHWE